MLSEKEIKNKEQQIWQALESVKDPEIPVISVVDLGIITKVSVSKEDHALVHMTPTFTGCPAIDHMRKEIAEAVENVGFLSSEVKVDFEISWNSNRITERGKKQLENFGLGSPQKHEGEVTMELLEEAKCPFCSSMDTSLNSPFGSALCRSIHICYNCAQTFERFKPV